MIDVYIRFWAYYRDSARAAQATAEFYGIDIDTVYNALEALDD